AFCAPSSGPWNECDRERGAAQSRALRKLLHLGWSMSRACAEHPSAHAATDDFEKCMPRGQHVRQSDGSGSPRLWFLDWAQDPAIRHPFVEQADHHFRLKPQTTGMRVPAHHVVTAIDG